MIQDEGKYYLYRHVRLDKNEPFYIGIGTKYHKKSTGKFDSYKRAMDKAERNNIWKKIVAKTEYEIEILCESDNYQFIKQKEIEFISLYGRINLGTGTLANMTDGGEGEHGRVVSKETRKKKADIAHRKFRETGTYGLKSFKGKYHPRVVLSEEQVLEIVENSRQDNFCHKKTAKKYNVSNSTILDILSGRTWSHFTGIILQRKQYLLDKEKVKEIKKMLNEKVRGNIIAKHFNIREDTISRIKLRQTYKNINCD